MRSIKVGQQPYTWTAFYNAHLQTCECTITNLIDEAQVLVVIIRAQDSSFCTPGNIKLWIDFALNQGWYSGQMILEVYSFDRGLRVRKLEYCISDELKLIDSIIQKTGLNTTPLIKSKLIKYLGDFQNYTKLFLPTLFKLLYIHLGDGEFGPDYGFCPLTDKGEDNPSLLLTYDYIKSSNISDPDWQLPLNMIPFLHWGTDVYSFVDCATDDAPIYILDMNLKQKYGKWEDCFWLHCHSLYEWIEKWLSDDLKGKSLWLEMYRIKGLIE